MPKTKPDDDVLHHRKRAENLLHNLDNKHANGQLDYDAIATLALGHAMVAVVDGLHRLTRAVDQEEGAA